VAAAHRPQPRQSSEPDRPSRQPVRTGQHAGDRRSLRYVPLRRRV